jgi:hypothetical protein
MMNQFASDVQKRDWQKQWDDLANYSLETFEKVRARSA